MRTGARSTRGPPARRAPPVHPAARALLLALLGGCTTAPLHGQTLPQLYRIDEHDSRIHVITRRSGVLGFLGHEHVIVAHRFSGSVCADAARLDGSTLRVEIDAHSLVIDADSARAATGLGRAPSPADVAQLQRTLLGPARLAADSFPRLTFHTTSVAGVHDSLQVEGVIVIRNVAQHIGFPASATMTGDTIRLRSAFRLRQSTFGIRPERIAGVVRVADQVELYIALTALPTGRSCERAPRRRQGSRSRRRRGTPPPIRRRMPRPERTGPAAAW